MFLRPLQATKKNKLTPEKSILIKWIFLCRLDITTLFGIMLAEAGGLLFIR